MAQHDKRKNGATSPLGNETEQADLFPVVPEIVNLGLSAFELKGAALSADLIGTVNVNDAAQLTLECWQRAVAEWLLNLCRGDQDEALALVKRAYLKLANETMGPLGEENTGLGRVVAGGSA